MIRDEDTLTSTWTCCKRQRNWPRCGAFGGTSRLGVGQEGPRRAEGRGGAQRRAADRPARRLGAADDGGGQRASRRVDLVARPRVALLDVNVLVALFFADHIRHELAHDWLADHRAYGWATCPLTENGFIRVACHQPSADGVVRPSEAIGHLKRFQADAHHHDLDRHRVADRCLLVCSGIRPRAPTTDRRLSAGTGQEDGGRLATFDRAIPLEAVRGASPDLLAVIEALPS